MSTLEKFNFNNQVLSTVLINDEPWFIAKDVCAILELSNTSMAIKGLDDDELTKLDLGSKSGNTWFINEPGLYRLAIRSDKPAAKKFTKWIITDVLPQIRKTGSYNSAPKSFAEALRLAADQQEKIEA